jgi:hypothetical protein
VYFFFEGGENRSDIGDGPRVIRIDTRDLKEAKSLLDELAS